MRGPEARADQGMASTREGCPSGRPSITKGGCTHEAHESNAVAPRLSHDHGDRRRCRRHGPDRPARLRRDARRHSPERRADGGHRRHGLQALDLEERGWNPGRHGLRHDPVHHQEAGHSQGRVRRRRMGDADPRPQGQALGHHLLRHDHHRGTSAGRGHRVLPPLLLRERPHRGEVGLALSEARGSRRQDPGRADRDGRGDPGQERWSPRASAARSRPSTMFPPASWRCRAARSMR